MSCKCNYTGEETSPTGLGHCPQCHSAGTKAFGTDKGVWVIKTDKKGTNYWAKVAKTSIQKDGDLWSCTDCIKVEPPPTVEYKSKPKCISGKCQEGARFYELETHQTVNKAAYGDIVRKDATTFIIDKQGTLIQLEDDSNNQSLIPDKFLKELGIFHWDNISAEANLGYPYNRKNFEDLQQQLYKGNIHLEGLLKEYGIIIVTALSKPEAGSEPLATVKRESKPVAKRVVKRESKPVAKRVVKRESKPVAKRLEKRTIKQLYALAKKRGRKVPSRATKAELIQILRSSTGTKRKRRGCYEAMTKAELVKRAAKKNVSGRSTMTKTQLIHALRK